ncbi:F-box protein [Scheffersomyces coipomensis]|uniref:F-box protein n=1 Tax=Scheffersomyces coipomensis TaxID=1788519 RepID=UPI00315C5CC2
MSGGTKVIDSSGSSSVLTTDNKEPVNESLSERDHQAIALFEQAIEKEQSGSMQDAVGLYRQAFKLNDRVDSLYRTERVPYALKKLKEERGKNVRRVDEDQVKKIDVDKLLASFIHHDAIPYDPNNTEDEDGMTIKFVNLGIEETVKQVEPVSPLINLPDDIWYHIIDIMILTTPESWFNFSITCKKHAYLGLGSSHSWRKMCNLAYNNQIYEENKLYLSSLPLGASIETRESLPIPTDLVQILPQYNNSYKHMLRERPFVKFLGCYISIVNYYIEGGRSEFSNSWANPVRSMTYYRYIRFYPDGTCVKVLTALEPNKVVPYLSKKNKNLANTILDTAVNANTTSYQIKEGQRIYHGTWTVSVEGEIHITIDNGAVPYYIFHYFYDIKPLGGIFKHNKLTWGRYYAIRKKMGPEDEREGEVVTFPLKNEKPFKFSRVKSYKLDN